MTECDGNLYLQSSALYTTVCESDQRSDKAREKVMLLQCAPLSQFTFKCHIHLWHFSLCVDNCKTSHHFNLTLHSPLVNHICYYTHTRADFKSIFHLQPFHENVIMFNLPMKQGVSCKRFCQVDCPHRSDG